MKQSDLPRCPTCGNMPEYSLKPNHVGVLKTAIREINAHVAVNGKGIMTDMTLNALRAAAGIGVKGE